MTDVDRDDERAYLLGTSDEEFVRLGFQHRVWAQQTFALWERAGFGSGQSLLDLGCGPGYATVDLAQLVGPAGRVVAIDSSERFIKQLESQVQAAGLHNVDARVGDVQRLNLPDASIDGAYARWLLCFVPEPEAVIAGVARALRPDGVFAVLDYFNYPAFVLWPRSDAFEHVVSKVIESWRLRGGDLDIAGRLAGLMPEHGLTVREIKPIVRTARPGSSLWQWPATFFKLFLPTLLEMNLITPGEKRAFESDWEARSNDPAAFLCTPPMLDVIAVKS